MIENKDRPIEEYLNDLEYLEQFVVQVLDYSSAYNSRSSRFYAPENLIGKQEVYPAYGDFVSAYSLRHYGKWWKDSNLHNYDYRPQDVDPLGAEEYVTLLFKSAVVPRDIYIYETYNPGSVVRIWGRLTGGYWTLLWEADGLEVCPQHSRRMAPKIRRINRMIDQVRLELNQSHLQYYTSLDAVLLGGLQPKSPLRYNLLLKNFFPLRLFKEETITETEKVPATVCNTGHFLKLPDLVLFHIFGYLDIRTISRCAQVDRQFYRASLTSRLYNNLSFKSYWSKINSDVLSHFRSRCRYLKKLDLSWCSRNGEDRFYSEFIVLLNKHRETLTHIALDSCDFINADVIRALSECKGLIELRMRNSQLGDCWYSLRSSWNNLVALDLSGCDIKSPVLMDILRNSPGLKYLNLDLCEHLSMDAIVDLATSCCPLLESWSSWKTHGWTTAGIRHLARCRNLTELDLGWCMMLVDPNESLTMVAQSCQNLEKLNVSGFRAADDQLLFPVVTACKDLRVFELVGLRSVTHQLCEIALNTLPNLELLDISYCDVSKQAVIEWKRMFPHVTVHRRIPDDSASGVI